jgi:hypothetical protein
LLRLPHTPAYRPNARTMTIMSPMRSSLFADRHAR